MHKDIVWDRYHKMYYRNDEKGFDRLCRSREHYTIDSKLTPILPRIEELFRTKSQITLEDMKEASN